MAVLPPDCFANAHLTTHTKSNVCQRNVRRFFLAILTAWTDIFEQLSEEATSMVSFSLVFLVIKSTTIETIK